MFGNPAIKKFIQSKTGCVNTIFLSRILFAREDISLGDRFEKNRFLLSFC